MSACTVSGTARSSTSRARRACARTARRRAGCRRRARGAPPGSRPAGACGRGGRCRSRAVLLVGERRERDRRRVALPSAPARLPLEELRARGAERGGAAPGVLQSSRCSRNSSSAPSAQCRSSTTRTHGRRAAIASRNRRQAVNASSRPTAAPSPADADERRRAASRTRRARTRPRRAPATVSLELGAATSPGRPTRGSPPRPSRSRRAPRT